MIHHLVYSVNRFFRNEVCIISYRIKDLREDSDLSQSNIAKILHMHRTTYARYETGEREIPFHIAILLAKYYDVSLDYLAGLTNKKGCFPKPQNKQTQNKQSFVSNQVL